MQQADQIKFNYRDRNSIPDFIEYEKPIILECYEADMTDNDWESIKVYAKICKNDFYLCLSNLEHARKANELHIKWYWGYPVNSYYEIHGLVNLGSEYIRLGAPIFFDWEQFRRACPGVKVRHVPNVAYSDGLPRPDGVTGTWIRPEDLDYYEGWISVIEFEDADREKEAELFNIYMVQREWPTDLGLLITNLNHIGVNRMIPPDFVSHRLTCQQRCEGAGKCQICYRTLSIANPDLVQKYKDTWDNQSLI